MTEPKELAPCSYRYVQLGRTFCRRALDEFDQEVWPQDCRLCPVPAWLERGICRHLDIGISLGNRAREEPPQAHTSCRFFGLRLEGLGRCETCPEFERGEAERMPQPPSALERLRRCAPAELVEEVRKELRMEAGADDPRMMTGCFRAGVSHCLYKAQYNPQWVLVLPPSSQGNADEYCGLVEGLLEQGGREGLFLLGPLEDVDSLCNLCLAVQQSAVVVIDLSEWDAKGLFALALGGALGRPCLLLRQYDSTPPFVPQGLPVFTYANGEELALLLLQGLGLELKEGPAGAEGEAPPDNENA
ncbi:MAG: hypothetical protein JXA37_00495 [Chloroflexia bacterium]|nr:hypothetical protein [Chloroflexia bacterium]